MAPRRAEAVASNEEPTQGRDPRVVEALAFQVLSAEAYGPQRLREDDDLAFQVPENQWTTEVKAQRQGQNVNGVPLPPRPMLSIPILDQPIQLQLNQQQNAHLGVQVHPLSEDATDDTAEVLQGIYRHIEVESRANLARSWAFDRAVKAGWSAYRVDVVYDDTTDDPRDLTIRINRILHASSVFLDPYAQQPDWSDGKRALIVSFVPLAQYKREYPKSKMASYGDDELSQLVTDYPFWIKGTDESQAVCVAEYFYTTYRDRVWVILDDGSFAFEDEVPEGRRIAAQNIRTIQWPEIHWCKINAVEVLEERQWNGRYIPIIPVIGKELQPFKGQRIWTGMIGPNKDAARLVNYEVSNAVEKDALGPKAPYIGAVGQFKTMSRQWDQANVRNFSRLEYDPVAAGGTLAPPPQRNLASVDLSSALQLVDLARNLVQVGTSTTDSAALENLAKRRVAKDTIAGLAQQGEVSNSNFLTSLADVSMPYEAKVVLDLIPTIFDRPGRIAQVLGMDNERKTVMLNAPFVVDPKTKRPRPAPEGQQPEGSGQVLRYDLNKGKYGWVVEIGKSYKTRMQQGADAFGEFLTAAPELIPILGDIWMEFQDFPGHGEAARRMKAMLPPQVKAADEQDQTPEALQAQLAQATQMVEALTQQNQQLTQQIETDAVKQDAENQRAMLKAAEATTLQQMKDAAKASEQIRQAGIDAATREDEQAHELALAAAEAAHEVETLEKQAEIAASQAAEAAATGMVQAEQGHAHAMEQQAAKPKPAAKPKGKG